MQNILTRSDVLNVLDTEVESKLSTSLSLSDQDDSKNIANNWSNQSDSFILNINHFSPKSPSKLAANSNSLFDGIERRETQDSISIFDQNNEGLFIPNDDLYSSNFHRSTFWATDSLSLLSLPNTKNQENIASKNVAKFNVEVDISNDFVYHRDDDRNRHGVSFKVWRNKKDGALLRPKLMTNCGNKKEIFSKMLNENNSTLKSEPIIYASKEIINNYEGNNGLNYTIGKNLLKYI